MDVLTPDQRRRNMKAIRSTKTQIEELLAKGFKAKGLRFRRDNTGIFGKPDFTFRRSRIAVFCDSEYFHGKDWEVNKHRIKTNIDFWQCKIEGNIARDMIVNNTLLKDGWKVIRFWGEDIKKNLDFCINLVIKEIEAKKTEIHKNKKQSQDRAREK
jgi:DNA mismatch endonuclease (patch repair protein)